MSAHEVDADLHLHTTASDGTVSVDERLTHARTEGLAAIAVTDHDTIAPELTARRELRDGIELITGVEIKADLHGAKIEILGYYVDPTDEALVALLDRATSYRQQRNEEILHKLSTETNLDVSRADIPSPRGSLGRPHFAQYLVENDVVPSIQAAFDDYLADGESCYVPMERIDHHEVITVVQNAGGVASLAHPGRMSSEKATVEAMVTELGETPLDAIEVPYPYSGGGSRYADVTVSEIEAMATANGFLQTGGSDCHGPGSGKFRIGSVGVSTAMLDEIRQQARRRRPFSQSD